MYNVNMKRMNEHFPINAFIFLFLNMPLINFIYLILNFKITNRNIYRKYNLAIK